MKCDILTSGFDEYVKSVRDQYEEESAKISNDINQIAQYFLMEMIARYQTFINPESADISSKAAGEQKAKLRSIILK